MHPGLVVKVDAVAIVKLTPTEFQLLQQLAAIPGIAGAHIMAPQNPSAIPEVIAAAGVGR